MTIANNTERQYQKLLNSEVVLCTKLIIQNARIDELHKVVFYNEGWSDSRVLAELQRQPGRDKLKVSHIIDFRRENFGHLESEASTRRSSATSALSLQALLERVVRIELELSALKQRVSQ